MDVVIVDRQRARRVPTGALAAYMRRVAREAPATSRDGVVVLLCGDTAMRRLNARFRGKDTTTDVLSFPAGDGVHPDGGCPLGEIAISVPQASRQARTAGHSLGRFGCIAPVISLSARITSPGESPAGISTP